MTIRSAIECKKISYLKQNLVTKKFELVKGSDGYYCQVQMALAITKLTSCVFLVWSKHELLETEVPFDLEFWKNELEPALEQFYRNFIVREIVTGVLKRSDVTSSACNSDTIVVSDSVSDLSDQNQQDIVPNSQESRCFVCKAILLSQPKFAKDFSVGCECVTCQPECEIWVHWRCCKPKYTKKHSENGRKWYCDSCKTHLVN